MSSTGTPDATPGAAVAAHAPGVARRGRPPVHPEVRFWAKVATEDDTDCWAWTGAIKNGYGVFGVAERVTVYAHRFAYESMVGPVADDLELDHLCRVRHCVNPAHLEPVTHSVNMQRAYDAWSA